MVILEEQASSNSKTGMSGILLQETVNSSSNGSVTKGAVVSSIIKIAVVEVAFPQSSVAVKVTVADPVAPQSSLNTSKSLLQVTFEQLSEADAPPLESNQAFKSA